MKTSIKQYSQTLFELTEGKSEQEILAIVIKFVQRLKADGQLGSADKIMEKFSQIYNEKKGIVLAEITTRYKMQDTNYKQVEDFIKDRYKAEKVEMNFMVDEKIQGGIIIRVGDEILDGSVSAQLKKLQKQLIS